MVIDAISEWLVQWIVHSLLVRTGHGTLGASDERILAEVAKKVAESIAGIVDDEHQESLSDVLGQRLADLKIRPPSDSTTLLDSLVQGIDMCLAALDDPHVTGQGVSYLNVVGVDLSTLRVAAIRTLVRAIQLEAATNGRLVYFANQLNSDLAELRDRQIRGDLRILKEEIWQLADQVTYSSAVDAHSGLRFNGPPASQPSAALQAAPLHEVLAELWSIRTTLQWESGGPSRTGALQQLERIVVHVMGTHPTPGAVPRHVLRSMMQCAELVDPAIDDPRPVVALTRSLQDRGEYRQALELLLSVAERSTTPASAILLNVGATLTHMNRFRLASDFFDLVLELHRRVGHTSLTGEVQEATTYRDLWLPLYSGRGLGVAVRRCTAHIKELNRLGLTRLANDVQYMTGNVILEHGLATNDSDLQVLGARRRQRSSRYLKIYYANTNPFHEIDDAKNAWDMSHIDEFDRFTAVAAEAAGENNESLLAHRRLLESRLAFLRGRSNQAFSYGLEALELWSAHPYPRGVVDAATWMCYLSDATLQYRSYIPQFAVLAASVADAREIRANAKAQPDLGEILKALEGPELQKRKDLLLESMWSLLMPDSDDQLLGRVRVLLNRLCCDMKVAQG